MTQMIIEKDLSFRITGVCFKVQNNLGRLLTEKQYADALEAELEKNQIIFIREPHLITNDQIITIGRPDFLIADKVVLDAKAKKFITKDDFNQMMKYLTLLNIELGLIVNFRASFLKPKRILNPNFNS